MSNRDTQPFKFSCPTCGEGIEITITQGKDFQFAGATNKDFKGPFKGDNPFVDLHLDFPVFFRKYKMGNTPYMVATKRIGFHNFRLHNFRLEALNQLHPHANELRAVIRSYAADPHLFSKLCESNFSEIVKTHNQEDINAALYNVIAKVFFPFSMPDDNRNAVEQCMSVIFQLAESNKKNFDNFMTEIVDSEFLTNIQMDCLEIYPRILEAELPLRPALFLDFDDIHDSKIMPSRVSVDNFISYKDLYKDISEIISRQLILVAALNNMLHRGDYNKFKDLGKSTPSSLHKYADVPYGNKLTYLDDNWYMINNDAIDNQLRNAIAHYKAEYDPATQIVTYYPKYEGIKQEKSEKIYFLDFMRKILISYREMHKMHQLIKCLHNYYFFVHE